MPGRIVRQNEFTMKSPDSPGICFGRRWRNRQPSRCGGNLRTVLATPDNPEANATATDGAICKVKINPGNSVDGQCNLTGGPTYVVYHN